MNWKWMPAVAAALVLALAASASAAAPTLFVGDAKKYAVAFKTEGEAAYVMEFAGSAHCYFTEPHEDLGGSGFSVFAAPELMARGPRGFVAEDSFSTLFGGGSARIRAEFDGSAVTGDYSYDESEESYHCDTGFSPLPFAASRFLPVGDPAAAPPASGEKRVYYGSEPAIEIFLRTTGREVAGIRGSFGSQCPVEREKASLTPHALFSHPAVAKRGQKGGFRKRSVEEGRTRSGAAYRETSLLTGRVEEDAISGSYLRVRTTGGRTPAERCVTGPIPFRALRYLPERG
jgi:hypothetical protein